MLILAIINILAFIMLVRSVLMIIGAYKDPLLASFEKYGEEHFFSPVVSLVAWAAIFLYVFLFWYIPPEFMFAIGVFIVLPITSSYGMLLRILKKYQGKLSHYPRWFYELVEMTDRDERRRIAYMWLFLPASTRMIYNANNYLFRQWVEQVLLTVAATSPVSDLSGS